MHRRYKNLSFPYSNLKNKNINNSTINKKQVELRYNNLVETKYKQ
jgi:hypothetical protein